MTTSVYTWARTTSLYIWAQSTPLYVGDLEACWYYCFLPGVWLCVIIASRCQAVMLLRLLGSLIFKGIIRFFFFDYPICVFFYVDVAAVRQLSVCLSGGKLAWLLGSDWTCCHQVQLFCSFFFFFIHVGVCHLIKYFNVGDLTMIYDLPIVVIEKTLNL